MFPYQFLFELSPLAAYLPWTLFPYPRRLQDKIKKPFEKGLKSADDDKQRSPLYSIRSPNTLQGYVNLQFLIKVEFATQIEIFE